MTNWTPQQQAVIDHVAESDRSLVVEAVAGSGKTTTIFGCVKALPAPANAIVLAFNKSIASEIEARLKSDGADWKHCSAKTVHALGFAAFRKSFKGQVKVEGSKVRFILDDMMDAHRRAGAADQASMLKKVAPTVANLVSLAKQSLVGFIGNMDDLNQWHAIADHHDVFNDLPGTVSHGQVVDWALKALRTSNEDTGTIDFDDMIYLPLLYKCTFWTYNVIFVDEAQDTNAARRALVRASLRKGGKVIAVGDRFQAIYGFTGADSDALDLIKQDFNAQELPLSVCFRCATSIIEYAQQWVPHLEAASGAGRGLVDDMLLEEMDWSQASASDVVLCRNNAPLVKTAYQLLRDGVACYIEGRDVGEAIVKLATHWKIKTIAELEARLTVYQDREIAKALAKKNESWAAQIEDRVDTLRVFIERVRANGSNLIADVVADIRKLFGDTEPGQRPKCLTLSSIHKSKGREWNTVYWYDMAGTLPSKWARQEWQLDQEENLCYVAATRAEERLVHVIPPAEEKEAA